MQRNQFDCIPRCFQLITMTDSCKIGAIYYATAWIQWNIPSLSVALNQRESTFSDFWKLFWKLQPERKWSKLKREFVGFFSLVHALFFFILINVTAAEWAVDESVGHNSDDRELKSHYPLSIYSRDVRISIVNSSSNNNNRIGSEKSDDEWKKLSSQEHKYEA